MSLTEHFKLLAYYSQWMNLRILDAAARLPTEELNMDRGAYFRSIMGTLNHLVVGDTIWLKRFACHPHSSGPLTEVLALPSPARLDQRLFEDFDALHSHRTWLDEKIVNWAAQLSDSDLDDTLEYRNTMGVPATRQYGSLVMHFFNHQTHHRGQLSTLLYQAGIDIGVTDLLPLIPESH
ncbi:DinB family protein [Halomonas huangheensis]|uniref:Diguanylate cyclase n=1 Tax=Halomonas huangheensis TaxID=1178482 RepID=W1N306_9GAMM|nr:DinB family protein [Halomonas huangheensis]ALM51493.1 diguanylate cyclase [Halomonas huangheensis]ERL49952.1 hypothetical protein BJB45_02175 [Halomonas huangheensis]